MEEEKNAFYVVRKGDVIGVYKSLSDCQAQAGLSTSNPSVSVSKGYGLSKDAEDYLVARGLKSASYSINAADVQNDLFGNLVPCPIRQPFSSRGKVLGKRSLPERLPQEVAPTSVPTYPWVNSSKSESCPEAYYIPSVFMGPVIEVASTSVPTYHQRNNLKSESSVASYAVSSSCSSCILEFDGASRGNPGPAGAGAVLRAVDGSVVFRFREGLGIATNNAAEYRGVILGLKQALRKGYRNIRVHGDSNLVCMQIQGLWKTKNQNLAVLCKEAKELKDRFISFEIKHIPRELNSEADAQANLAVSLRDGQVEEDCQMK